MKVRDTSGILHRKISSTVIPKKQEPKPKPKSSEMGLARIEQLKRMSMQDLIRHAKSLGLRNIEYKKIDPDKSKSVNREKPDIAKLIFQKEIEENI